MVRSMPSWSANFSKRSRACCAALLGVVADGLGRDPAARRAEFGDQFEQPVLGVGGQVHQQSLGQPGGGLRRIEALFLECGRPVLAQIDGHLVAFGNRLHAVFGQRLGLVVEHLGLVDLVHVGAGRPVQPVGARVQTRGQDHDLADAGRGGLGEERVEEVCPHRLVVEHVGEHRGGFGIDLGQPVGDGRRRGSSPTSRCRRPPPECRAYGIADQGVGTIGLTGARGGHQYGGRTHARRDVPGVVISAQSAHGSGVPNSASLVGSTLVRGAYEGSASTQFSQGYRTMLPRNLARLCDCGARHRTANRRARPCR